MSDQISPTSSLLPSDIVAKMVGPVNPTPGWVRRFPEPKASSGPLSNKKETTDRHEDPLFILEPRPCCCWVHRLTSAGGSTDLPASIQPESCEDKTKGTNVVVVFVF